MGGGCRVHPMLFQFLVSLRRHLLPELHNLCAEFILPSTCFSDTLKLYTCCKALLIFLTFSSQVNNLLQDGGHRAHPMPCQFIMPLCRHLLLELHNLCTEFISPSTRVAGSHRFTLVARPCSVTTQAWSLGEPYGAADSSIGCPAVR